MLCINGLSCSRIKQYINGALETKYFGDLCCKISINVSTCDVNNCQFLDIRGRSVIGVLRILKNPENCQFLAILGICGRSVIGALHF